MSYGTLDVLLFVSSVFAIALLYSDLTGAVCILKGKAGKYAFFAGLLIPFSLLFPGSVQLRNRRFYLLWLFPGAGMLFFCYQFSDSAVFHMKSGTALNRFKSLPGFLIVFRPGRAIFINVTGREYVTPSIGGSSDLFEGRKPQLADFIMSGILFFTIIAAQGI